MKTWIVGSLFALLAVSVTAQQQTVTTSGGTTNNFPIFTGTKTIGNSVMTQSGSNIGIGTTSPSQKLDVSGNIKLSGGSNRIIADWSSAGTFGSHTFIQTSVTNGGTFVRAMPNGSAPYSGFSAYGSSDPENSGVVGFGINDAKTNEAAIELFATGSGTAPDFSIYNGNWTSILNVKQNGNVGIGATAPAYRLDVVGTIHSTGGIVFPDGSTQTIAFNPTFCGGDYAESVDVRGDRKSFGPGDVLVIDPSSPGKFLKASDPYSTLVVGIYSTKPGMVGRRQTTDAKTSPTEVPMAMVGIVPTKVSAENGPIKTGDLLVASRTSGRAMKGTDRSLLIGAVIGKALGPLDSGTGVIEVLVTLQ